MVGVLVQVIVVILCNLACDGGECAYLGPFRGHELREFRGPSLCSTAASLNSRVLGVSEKTRCAWRFKGSARETSREMEGRGGCEMGSRIHVRKRCRVRTRIYGDQGCLKCRLRHSDRDYSVPRTP